MIRKHVTTVVVFLLVATLLGATPALAGPPGDTGQNGGGQDDDGQTVCSPGEIVDNEEMRIWFQGKKGQLQVFKKNDANDGIDGMYQYKTIGIEEQNENNRTIAELNLERAHPQDSECTIEENDGWINVTYTVEATVRATGDGGDDGGAVGTANVTFVYKFNRTNTSAKFDLLVRDWPWNDEDGERLLYDFDVTSDQWTIERAENGLGFRDDESGEAEASITWAPNATATYDDGHEEEAVVDSTVTGSDSHVHVDLAFTRASPGYVELDYDPRVGVGPYVIVGPVLVPLPDQHVAGTDGSTEQPGNAGANGADAGVGVGV